MSTYDIIIRGCDDSTTWSQELTDEQAKLLKTIAARSGNESEYDCQPTLTVTESVAASQDVSSPKGTS